MRYKELFKVLMDDYGNDARQLAAQSELERLTFDQAMLEGDLKSLDADFTYLVDKINVLTPQACPEFRSEEHKTDSFARPYFTQIEHQQQLHK